MKSNPVAFHPLWHASIVFTPEPLFYRILYQILEFGNDFGCAATVNVIQRTKIRLQLPITDDEQNGDGYPFEREPGVLPRDRAMKFLDNVEGFPRHLEIFFEQ